MTCGGTSRCFVHDWQNKSGVCLFSLFSLTCWYDRLYEMKEVSNHFYSCLPLTFSWSCVQPVSFFISRTVTGVHMLIDTIVRFKYKLHLKLKSNAWTFHVLFIWKTNTIFMKISNFQPTGEKKNNNASLTHFFL